jgi:hypothetical protein
MLEQLDAKFDDMSSQIIERSALFAPSSCNTSFIRHIIVIQISERVDALEASIQDIINNGDALASSGSVSSITQLPSPAQTPIVQSRRIRGGLQ